MRDQVKPFDCVIVGAGQAGLSAGRSLQIEGLNFVILERGDKPGAEWDRRAPDHLLFTPRSFSKLPGLPMADPSASGCPTNKEMGEYFEQYAKMFSIPVRTNSDVTEINHDGVLFFISLSDGTTITSHSVVLANGSNQMPLIPAALAEPVSSCSSQSTGRDFWRELPAAGSRVLVVGDGASGRQAALDYAARGYNTTLSGANRRLAPAKIIGKSLFFWLLYSRLLFADRDTLRAKLLRRLNPVPSKKALGDASLKAAGVTILPKLAKTLAAVDTKRKPCAQATFRDGTQANFDHITWCVGYTENSAFNGLADRQSPEWYTQGRGHTNVPGLFVTGRVWLSSRASELIIGAPHDAKRAVDAVIHHLAKRQGSEATITSRASESEKTHA